jgi:outer membrane lipoprotein carrier protein
MQLLRYIMCASLVLSPQLAQAKKKAEVKAKPTFSLSRLHNSYKKAQGLEADFVQEVYQASLARTKTSRGSIKLAKPNLVRWEISEPEASVMVSNGRRVSYFTPDARGKGKGQVIERSASELQRQPLFRILAGSSPLEKEFSIMRQTSLEDGTELLLKPKKPMGDLEQAILRVSAKYLIEEMILETHSGNKTKITLQNQALGAKLPRQLFEFKPPADTEILRN